jgi:hypothetical protein
VDPFVRQLVQRLHAPGAPLSRNRHFHTFETPEGRAALRISRRLRSLARDIQACSGEGRRVRCTPSDPGDAGEVKIQLTLERLSGKRTSLLTKDEFELLRELPELGAEVRWEDSRG